MFESIKKNDFLLYVQREADVHIDSYIESAVNLAVEVHQDVKREDGKSSFLETHIFPVVIDVIRHYKQQNKPLTTVQIVSAILHDVLEDNERILDLHASQSYGFDAYFRHKFGDYVYKTSSLLKTRSLDIYSGSSNAEREFERFRDYCNLLVGADYGIKVVKLADRLNNMQFISELSEHEKIKRYIREAEDFYIAYTLIEPRMDDFYLKMRETYEDLVDVSKKKSIAA